MFENNYDNYESMDSVVLTETNECLPAADVTQTLSLIHNRFISEKGHIGEFTHILILLSSIHTEIFILENYFNLGKYAHLLFLI